MVEQEVLACLHRWFGEHRPTWLVDSKNDAILEILPGEIDLRLISGNRDEMFALAKRENQDVVLIPRGKGPSIELLEVIRSLSNPAERRTHPKWIAMKLDEQGACLHPTAAHQRTLFAPPFKRLKSEGIAAGDFFNAIFQLAFLNSPDSHFEPDPTLRLATACAAGWLDFCHRYWGEGTSSSSAESQKSDIVQAISLNDAEGRDSIALQAPEAETWKTDPFQIDERMEKLKTRYLYAELRKEENAYLDLSDATGFLGEFISTDTALRSRVRVFVERIRDYTKGEGKTRPLNCLVVAPPGSGKSFFVQQVAKQVDCEVVEVNCAQVVSPDDLLQSIAALQGTSARDKNAILFLDEVDTNTGFYPFLLAPLWDASVSVRGEKREWRERTVSILVASRFKTPDSYVKELRDSDENKSRDLASRLNGPRLSLCEMSNGDTVSPEARTTRVYLTLSVLSRYYDVYQVEVGLLDLVYGAPRFRPRAIEHFVAALKRPSDGVVKLDRDGQGFERVVELARNLEYDVDQEHSIPRPSSLEVVKYDDRVFLSELSNHCVRLVSSDGDD